MAENLDLDALLGAVWNEDRFFEDPFSHLRALSVALSAADLDPELDRRALRNAVIRCLDYRERLGQETELLDALIRKLGLFPYLSDGLDYSTADALAREVHDAPFRDRRVVFHSMQAAVFWRLLGGDNVILSAPTSFGKSLIIDALMLTERYENMLVVVPTLALIDETRRRLAKHETPYKIVTHSSQTLGERNVLVLTQERVVERAEMPDIDFFAIDEFYKLGSSDERAQLLNRVFYRLRKTGAQYYLLGPNIQGLSEAMPEQLQREFVHTEDTTVALEVVTAPQGADRNAALVELCNELHEPTLIFVSSPRKAHETALTLMDGGIDRSDGTLSSAVEWTADNYHSEWVVGKALSAGIGIHHAQLPRSLGQFMVRAFEQGRIHFLICTSTLIEGVNTQAKNVVVLDDKIANRRVDFFTFNNILGRSGRMFRHFTGRVFLFHDQPAEQLFEVDIPILSQADSVPAGLLLHVDAADLQDSAGRRLNQLLERSALERDVLEANTGIDPEQQIQLAEELLADPASWNEALGWRGQPSWEQLKQTCHVIFEYLQTTQLRSPYVRSSQQLAYRLSKLSQLGSARALIAEELATEPNIDVAVQGVSEFLRRIAGYGFPMRLRALERIQQSIFRRLEMMPGSYGPYAVRVENLFLPDPLIALDEYGIPPELARKLADELQPNGDLDEVLARLAKVDRGRPDLTSFEVELLVDAQDSL